MNNHRMIVGISTLKLASELNEITQTGFGACDRMVPILHDWRMVLLRDIRIPANDLVNCGWIGI